MAAPFYSVKLVRRLPGPLPLEKKKEAKSLHPALAKRIDNTPERKIEQCLVCDMVSQDEEEELFF